MTRKSLWLALALLCLAVLPAAYRPPAGRFHVRALRWRPLRLCPAH